MGGRPVIKTINGYLLPEVVSALQKSIRRCDEHQALFWAAEMDESGYSEYCWKRLRIIATEDVGLGDPMACVVVNELYNTWDWMRRKKQPEPIFLAHAVIHLVRAKKSRMIDHAVCVYWQYRNIEKPEVPDYALDMHTARGRAKGRGFDHFQEAAGVLNNRAEDVEDPYWDIYLAGGQAYYSKGKKPKTDPEGGDDEIEQLDMF